MAVGTFVPTGEPALRREFQCTEFLNDKNHNKFYIVEVWPLNDGAITGPYDEVFFRAKWGRVGYGESVSEKTVRMRDVEKQIHSKLNKGAGQTSYHEIALHTPTVVVYPL
jgi:predicted DNA-binding WGR domain protein